MELINSTATFGNFQWVSNTTFDTNIKATVIYSIIK